MSTRQLFLIGLILLSISLVGCTIFDRVKVEITQPRNNIRLTDIPLDGVTSTTELRVNYEGSKPVNVAQVFVNGVNMGQCQLYIGNNVCGTYTLTKGGNQNITIQVSKENGELVTAETNFVWKPYSFAETLLNNTFGTETNLTLVFAIVAIVVVSVLITKAVNGGIGGVILTMWVTSGIAAIVMSQYGALAGIITLNKFFAFWGGIAGTWVAMQILLAMINKGYQLKIGGKQATYTGYNGSQFSGSSAGMSIGPGQEITRQDQSDPFATAVKIAETESRNQSPFELNGVSQPQLLGSYPRAKKTIIEQPTFIGRLLGKKPVIHNVVEIEDER